MTPFPSSPKARRLGLMLALCLVIEASAPAPALAWFGWLDEWSGPGEFWGLLYEMRLVCFGPEQWSRGRLWMRMQRAQQLHQLSRSQRRVRARRRNDFVPASAVEGLAGRRFMRCRLPRVRWKAPAKYQEQLT